MTVTRITYKKKKGKYTVVKVQKGLADTHKIRENDPGIPTDEDFASGRIKFVRRGRPKKLHPKERLDIRFDHDVAVALRSLGHGWSTQVNNVMREFLIKNGIVAKH